jgi:fibronectin-binding autotransporter adhesin
MKIKRLASLASALVLSLSSLLIINFGTAFATIRTCTWTGTNSNNFNDAGNWMGCNSTIPQTNDNLLFDNSNNTINDIGSDTVVDLNNDIVGLTVGNITFQGASQYGFRISGNTISVVSTITDNTQSGNIVDAGLTFTGDATITAGDSLFAGPINFGSHTLSLNTNGEFVISGGPIAGSGQVTISGTGWVELHADVSNLTSNVTVQSGVLDGGWGSGSITIANGASWIIEAGQGLNDPAITLANPITVTGVGGLAGDNNYGAISLSDIQSPTGYPKVILSGHITLTGDTQFGATSGGQLTLTGPISGAHTLATVSQSGLQLILNSSNNTSNTPNGTQPISYNTSTIPSSDQTGADQTVGFGQELIVDGKVGNVEIFNLGLLKGSGVFGNIQLDNGGIIAPGHSPGCMNTGNVTLSGTYQAEIGGTTACTGYDQLNVTGTVDVTGGTLATSLYNNYKPKAGEAYTIINNDGNDAVTGTFTGLPEGATFNVSGYVFQITYKGGSGNDVVLTVKSVPAVPDTGFAMISSNPSLMAAVAILAAGSILAIARQTKRVPVPVRVKK